jgi:phosphoribosylglycinamide formyltransferase-1
VSKLKVGVLVSGRGSNLQALIDAAERGSLSAEIAIVISDVEDADALGKARRAGIEARYIDPRRSGAKLSRESEQEVIESLDERGVGLVALAGFMRILRPDFVRHFKHRIMNIHPSLLPCFPGLNVQKKALDYGVKLSGCTVHFVDEGVDTGPIVVQAAVPVLEGDTVDSLSGRILEQEHRIYAEAVNLFAEGRIRIQGRVVHILPKGAQ